MDISKGKKAGLQARPRRYCSALLQKRLSLIAISPYIQQSAQLCLITRNLPQAGLGFVQASACLTDNYARYVLLHPFYKMKY